MVKGIDTEKSEIESINIPEHPGCELYIKREDKIHPHVSGNKYRKLKYNLIIAKKLGYDTLLTFGGAHSNHIAATASAGKLNGFKTIGIIRGEELENKKINSPTLNFAVKLGMQLKFVSRSEYRRKNTSKFIQSLENEFRTFYVLPEGGTNELAVRGCEEILKGVKEHFDFVCCPVGTGGTIAGLINCSQPGQQVLGFPALMGSFLHKDISKFVSKTNWELINDYHFGGYAKINDELISFINKFKNLHNIPLDPIYTGKMIFGIMNMLESGYFPQGSKILAIHTGGLQGIEGMNQKLKHKHKPIINI